jgi:dienelactone hydrolase
LKKKLGSNLLILITTVLVLGACGPASAPSTMPPRPTEGAAPTSAPTAEPPATGGPGDLPPAVEYNLGEATIVQERFPEGDRFRTMPVRLNGLIATPSGEGGPYPVVLILHGNHHGCPTDEMGVDRWPCDPEVEQPNYRGFAYLVRDLAARGYVALSININAENTFGFGEPVPGERLEQLVDLHLAALATAAAGGNNDFGVELSGRADARRLALVGHSRGGEESLRLARQLQDEGSATASRPYGPVSGLLLLASTATAVEPTGGSPVPMAIVLPACDGDVTSQEGQHFYEAARLAPQQTQWATSAWLERGNHNYFNQLLPDDPFGRRWRPDCETILEPETQRGFLIDYAADFLTTIWSQDPEAVREAIDRLGLDVRVPVPDELYGLPARGATLADAADRRPLLVPATAEELTTHLVGGAVTEEGITTHFCPEGHYTPAMMPGSEPCRRVTVTIPGQPALAIVSWAEPDGVWRFALPAGEGDLSGYTTFSLRAAVDPLSPLNAVAGPQSFSLQLTDRTGNSVAVPTRPDEPALAFPAGLVEEDEFSGEFFTGPVPLTTTRWTLTEFDGVDLTDIGEIALLLDQTPSGSLFLADLEWVRPSHP